MDHRLVRKVLVSTLIILVTIITAIGKPLNRSLIDSIKLKQSRELAINQDELLAKPRIDERVEIMSIVFRLAGNPEYNSEVFKKYVEQIKGHYTPYKDHAFINYVKQVKKEQGLGYDAIMSMAIHLDKDLNIKSNDSIVSLDRRWSRDDVIKFSNLLKQFYKDTQSEKFFRQNKSLYHEVEKRFLPIYQAIDVSWYHRFYGKEPSEKFLIVNGLGNGGSNYGVAVNIPNSKKEVYAIMGT